MSSVDLVASLAFVSFIAKVASTLRKAVFTRSSRISPLLARFSISSALVLPDDRHAMLNRLYARDEGGLSGVTSREVERYRVLLIKFRAARFAGCAGKWFVCVCMSLRDLSFKVGCDVTGGDRLRGDPRLATKRRQRLT